MKKWILFDFDGTITHSMDVAYLVYQRIAEKYRLSHLSKQELMAIKALPLFDKIRALGIHVVDFPKIMKDTQKVVREFLEHTELMPEMKELLLAIKQKYRLAVISSNTKKNIKTVFELHQLDVFDKIYGKAGLFTKDEQIQRILRKYRLKKEEVLYVGDEVRDITACQTIGVQIASVTWGFDDERMLSEKQPTYLIHTVADLGKLLLEDL